MRALCVSLQTLLGAASSCACLGELGTLIPRLSRARWLPASMRFGPTTEHFPCTVATGRVDSPGSCLTAGSLCSLSLPAAQHCSALPSSWTEKPRAWVHSLTLTLAYSFLLTDQSHQAHWSWEWRRSSYDVHVGVERVLGLGRALRGAGLVWVPALTKLLTVCLACGQMCTVRV